MTSRRRTSRRMRVNRRSSRRLYANANASSAIDPRSAVMYFYLHFEYDNAEKDARKGKQPAKDLIADEFDLMSFEFEQKAMRKLAELFKIRWHSTRGDIVYEDRDTTGDMICKFSVDSWADVNRILKILNQRNVGGDDDTNTGVPYFVARAFTLYPRGVNGPRFSNTTAFRPTGVMGHFPRGITPSKPAGTLTEWVEEHKP